MRTDSLARCARLVRVVSAARTSLDSPRRWWQGNGGGSLMPLPFPGVFHGYAAGERCAQAAA
jgi:hypothetical protein